MLSHVNPEQNAFPSGMWMAAVPVLPTNRVRLASEFSASISRIVPCPAARISLEGRTVVQAVEPRIFALDVSGQGSTAARNKGMVANGISR